MRASAWFGLLVSLAVLSGCPSSQGPQGDPGLEGPAGAAGPQGVTGAAGPQGLVGAQGAMGDPGPAGAQGTMGVQGAPGQVLVLDGGVVSGPPGASVVVTPEPPGAACPSGGVRVTQVSDAGISVLCNGAGLSVSVLPALSPQCAAGGALIRQADGGAAAVCNGAAGMAGQQGAVGAQGSAGAQGAAGTQGPVGAQGSAGAPGPAGAAGPQGPAGPPGAVLLVDGGLAGASDRYEFAGFTASVFTGALGGVPGANALCSAEFAGSYLCADSDYRLAEPSAAPGGAGAWIDDGRLASGLRTSFRCDNNTGISWSYGGTADNGLSLGSTGGTTFVNCDQAKPLACCRRGARVVVRGLTAMTYSGNLGGVPAANAKCVAEYPGSFFCTETDYRTAESSVVPGAAGGWIDDQRNSTTGLRTSFRCDNNTGITWTYGGPADQGLQLGTTGGTTFVGCDQVKPLVCCQLR